MEKLSPAILIALVLIIGVILYKNKNPREGVRAATTTSIIR
ncbi:hypothetical protein ACFSZS_29295 [Seohaeicola zhoushanensis]